jgi:hypothetical protein
MAQAWPLAVLPCSSRLVFSFLVYLPSLHISGYLRFRSLSASVSASVCVPAFVSIRSFRMRCGYGCVCSHTWQDNPRRTPGSRMLRVIMDKFSRVDSSKSSSYWGAPFDGSGERDFDAEEDLARRRILQGSLSLNRAEHVLQAVDPTCPFYSRIEFIEALAALCVAFPEVGGCQAFMAYQNGNLDVCLSLAYVALSLELLHGYRLASETQRLCAYGTRLSSVCVVCDDNL